MHFRLNLCLLFPAALLSGCVSFASYQPGPEDIFLVERLDLQNDRNAPDASAAVVVSLDNVEVKPQDRVRLSGVLEEDRDVLALKLSEGEHKIVARVCESGWAAHCGRAYLTLTASRGHYYGLLSTLSKTRDYIEVWVIDLRSGETVVNPLRVHGLTKSYF